MKTNTSGRKLNNLSHCLADVVRRWTHRVVLAWGMAVSPTAFAAEHCVGSVAELYAALNDAAGAASAQITTTIKLKQGTYLVGNSSLTQAQPIHFHAMELLGGYNSNCSARTVNPENTIFDAEGDSRIYFRPVGDLLIEGIRFRRNIFAPHHRVEIFAAAHNITLRVRNNTFDTVAFAGGAGYTPTGEEVTGLSLWFINNRVTDYPWLNDNSVVSVTGTATLRMTSNTVANNEGNNAVFLCENGNDVWLVDNIAWNNAGEDFTVFETCLINSAIGNARNRSNLYQSATLVPIGDSGSNLMGTDPLFVNAATGNYRLQNASPAVNSGVVSSSIANLDLAGNPRVVGSTIDRGAYESALNDTIPYTITVTNTADAGAGSLRQAILDANSNPDSNVITFSIPGTVCPQVIAPVSNLPTITHGVHIDGFTQAGSLRNTRSKGDNAKRCVLLAGGNARSLGLNFFGNSASRFQLQGLNFGGFASGSSGVALRIAGGRDNLVRGNQFGGSIPTNSGSLMLAGNDTNIELTGDSTSTVGGDSPADRNVIASANANGVLISTLIFLQQPYPSNNNDIIDNLIGSYGLESVAAGNGTGIKIQTSGNTVRDNTIINSGLDGIWMNVAAASGNIIQDNRIGVRDTICVGVLCFGGAAGNGRHGMFIDFGPHDNIVYRNTIRNNTQHGIFIFSDTGATSLRNLLIGNQLYDNGGAGTKFLTYNGADNDSDPAQQSMANRGLNYPVVTNASGGATQGVVSGIVNSINGNYSVDVFSSRLADASNPRGEAEVFHRSFSGVTISNAAGGQDGNAEFSIPFTSTVDLVGRVITLTVSDTARNTSELSAPMVYTLADGLFADGFE